MLAQAWDLFVQRNSFFWELFVQHMMISGIAILLSVVIGLVLGILISEFQKASRPTLSVVNILYTIPSLAMLGLLIPFSGANATTAVIALTAYGLLPMVKNTFTGITNISPSIIEAAKGMGSTRLQMLFRIRLPLAFPVIMAGFRNMVTMTISLTSIAAFIGAGGLGVAIFRGITTNNMPMVLVGSIITALLAVAVDLLLGAIEKRLRTGQGTARTRRRWAIITAVLAGVIALAALVGTVTNQAQGKEVRLASKSYTEQLVLGNIVEEYISATTDINVVHSSGISGGTSTIQPGLLAGEYDLYPEYTGTAWNTVLYRTDIYYETMYDELQAAYNEMGLTWTTKFGYNNTYDLAVPTALAQQYNLKTYSDLAKVAGQFTIGAEPDFYERVGCYDDLCAAYGFKFAGTMDLDTGLKYKAIAAGEVDVLVAYSTDGQLAGADVVILEDDKGFFPSYNAGIIARTEVVEQYPELAQALDELNNTITEEDMRKMNYAVDEEGEDPATVAHNFLVERKMIEGA